MVGLKDLLGKALRLTNSKIKFLFSRPADHDAHFDYPYEPPPVSPPISSPREYQQYYPLSRISAPDELSQYGQTLLVSNPDLPNPDGTTSLRSSVLTIEEIAFHTWESFEIQVTDEEEERLERESLEQQGRENCVMQEESQALAESDVFVLSLLDPDDENNEVMRELQFPHERPSSQLGMYPPVDIYNMADYVSDTDSANDSSPVPCEDDQSISLAISEDFVFLEQQTIAAKFDRDLEPQPTCIVSPNSLCSLSTSDKWEDISPRDTDMPQATRNDKARSLIDMELASPKGSPNLSFTQHAIARLRARNSLIPLSSSFDNNTGRLHPYSIRYKSKGPSRDNKRSATYSRIHWQNKSVSPDGNPSVLHSRISYSHRYRQRQRFLGRNWALWFAKVAKIKGLTKALRETVEDTMSIPPILPAIMAKDKELLNQRRNVLDHKWKHWLDKLAKVSQRTLDLQRAAKDLGTFESEFRGGFRYS